MRNLKRRATLQNQELHLLEQPPAHSFGTVPGPIFQSLIDGPAGNARSADEVRETLSKIAQDFELDLATAAFCWQAQQSEFSWTLVLGHDFRIFFL